MDNEKDKLTGPEVQVIQMALQQLIEDLEIVSKDVTVPLTPEARQSSKEMLEAAKSAKSKLAKHTNIDANMPPYKPGDEDEFLTKQS